MLAACNGNVFEVTSFSLYFSVKTAIFVVLKTIRAFTLSRDVFFSNSACNANVSEITSFSLYFSVKTAIFVVLTTIRAFTLSRDVFFSNSACNANVILRYLSHGDDKLLKLFEEPDFIKTPVVRNGKQATVGFCPEIWAKWE